MRIEIYRIDGIGKDTIYRLRYDGYSSRNTKYLALDEGVGELICLISR